MEDKSYSIELLESGDYYVYCVACYSIKYTYFVSISGYLNGSLN